MPFSLCLGCPGAEHAGKMENRDLGPGTTRPKDGESGPPGEDKSEYTQWMTQIAAGFSTNHRPVDPFVPEYLRYSTAVPSPHPADTAGLNHQFLPQTSSLRPELLEVTGSLRLRLPACAGHADREAD